jgi:hypothetical protein
MLIEYNFKFEKNGLTVTQRVGPGGASGSPRASGGVVEQNALKASFRESRQASAAKPRSGGGPGGNIGGNGGGPPDSGTAPVTFIGPFVMCCPSDDSTKDDKG